MTEAQMLRLLASNGRLLKPYRFDGAKESTGFDEKSFFENLVVSRGI
jgi:hypothetical protein